MGPLKLFGSNNSYSRRLWLLRAVLGPRQLVLVKELSLEDFPGGAERALRKMDCPIITGNLHLVGGGGPRVGGVAESGGGAQSSGGAAQSGEERFGK